MGTRHQNLVENPGYVVLENGASVTPSTIPNTSFHQYTFPRIPSINQSVKSVQHPQFTIHIQSVRGTSTPLINSSSPLRGIIHYPSDRSILHIHATYTLLHLPTSFIDITSRSDPLSYQSLLTPRVLCVDSLETQR